MFGNTVDTNNPAGPRIPEYQISQDIGYLVSCRIGHQKCWYSPYGLFFELEA